MRLATVVLPVPGLPLKLICKVGVSDESPMRRRTLIDEQERGDLADARLDRLQADKLGIELIENFADMGFGEFAAQIDVVRKLRRCAVDRLCQKTA